MQPKKVEIKKSVTSAQSVNLARVDTAVYQKYQLPGDILADLVDAFQYYDKENLGYISMPHFHSILQNFGFRNRSKKETDEELRLNDADILRRQGVDLEALKVFIGYRWVKKNGKYDEARECFRLFDKKDRGTINATDLKNTLSTYLEFQVSQADVEEFIEQCDAGGDNGNIDMLKFVSMYHNKQI